MLLLHMQIWRYFNKICDNYRIMHALFHIRTVIIPRPISTLGLKPSGRYRFLGMITVLIWKRAYINLFITYFNIELKRIKLTSHIDTKLMDLRDNSPNMETPTNVSSLGTDLFQTTIDSWAEVTSWG